MSAEAVLFAETGSVWSLALTDEVLVIVVPPVPVFTEAVMCSVLLWPFVRLPTVQLPPL